VYVSHGIHHCLNLTTGGAAAVLIRALEPLEGAEGMARRRRLTDPRLLCAGPGRLCQALDITLAEDGLDLVSRDSLWVAEGRAAEDVVTTPRVGLSVAVDVPWRFVERGTRFASRGVSGPRR
jgi:DNA-3-methyladenine glycosylase